MKTIVVLLAFLPTTAVADEGSIADSYNDVPPQRPAVLCADQADNRIRLFDPLTEGDKKATLWCYPRETDKPIHYRPTDAKRVEIDGIVHILAAYHGRVRLIRFKDQELVKDFSTYSSCHSAELLPDGAIVSANSNHGKLRLHHSADEFVDSELPYAHGVTWDKARRCLWVLGDYLYRFTYSKRTLVLEKKFELPLSPTGHDVFPLRKQAKLLVSNNDALFLFDVEKEVFDKISDVEFIKSASQRLDGSIWVSEPKVIEGAKEWQSDTLMSVSPDKAERRYTRDGSRFYKARWWQQVDFSY